MLWRRAIGWPEWDWTNPLDELGRIRRELDRLTEGVTGGLFKEPIAGVFSLMNVTKDKDNLYVRAELPGTKA